MAAHKKTSFYHTRNKICPNDKMASEILGVSIDDVKRMDATGDPVAEKLLLLWDRKYIGVEGWDGWLFSRGVLIHKNKRWRPDMLLQMRNDEDRADRLENELRAMYSVLGLIKISKKLLSKNLSKFKRMKIIYQ